MARERIFSITPATGEKIKAVVNWIDKEARMHTKCGNKVRDRNGPWCETIKVVGITEE